jgi:hypothetical protein
MRPVLSAWQRCRLAKAGALIMLGRRLLIVVARRQAAGRLPRCMGPRGREPFSCDVGHI